MLSCVQLSPHGFATYLVCAKPGLHTEDQPQLPCILPALLLCLHHLHPSCFQHLYAAAGGLPVFRLTVFGQCHGAAAEDKPVSSSSTCRPSNCLCLLAQFLQYWMFSPILSNHTSLTALCLT